MVWAVAVLDENHVVSGSDDRTLRVWDIESGETIQVLEGHTLGVTAVAALLSDFAPTTITSPLIETDHPNMSFPAQFDALR